MTFNIHPSAAENFNQKASELANLIKEIPLEPSHKNSFPSELHIAASVTEEDIIGGIEDAKCDYKGKTIARYFNENKKKYGLEGEGYRKLIKISEAIQSLPDVRSKISCSYVERALFSWIRDTHKGSGITQTFIEYLECDAKSKIESVTSWIPIANLEVESPFTVSKSEVRSISKNVIDKWESIAVSYSVENNTEMLKEFARIRKDYQGLAAVVTVIDAEPEHAFEYALEEAHRITSVLGMFSSAILMPDIKCISKVKGSENIAQTTVFFEYGDNGVRIRKSIVDKPAAFFWRLSNKDVAIIRDIALDKLSLLLAAESLSEFEETVLNSVLLYSRSAFTADPVEKVIYMLTALESVLLKNENEPIQQNIAERVAVFIAKELPKRKAIIRTIKSVYGVRSRYLHHGHTSSELELVSEFMVSAQIFFIQLIKNIDHFNSKEKFVTAIDDHKLA